MNKWRRLSYEAKECLSLVFILAVTTLLVTLTGIIVSLELFPEYQLLVICLPWLIAVILFFWSDNLSEP